MAYALADLVYVALGTAHYLGIPFNAVWIEVQRSNLAKELRRLGDTDHKRGSVEVIRKPPDWKPPAIAELIAAHNAQVGDEGDVA